MAERRRVRLDAPEGGRREPRRPGSRPLDAPPEASSAPLAFPWASSLAIGWGSQPARLPRRPSLPAARKRKPVAE